MTARKTPPFHILTQGKKEGYPQGVVYLDTETKWIDLPDGSQLHDLKLGWACYVSYRKKGVKSRKRHWYHIKTKQGFYKWLAPKIRPKRTLYVLGSNVWFDVRITGVDRLLMDDGFRCDQLYDKSMITILGFAKDDRKIVFISTQNFIPFSVEKIGQLLGKPKQKVDFRTCTTEQLLAYCKVDTDILIDFFEKWLDFAQRTKMGSFRVTIASQSLTAFRSRFMRHKIRIHNNQNAIALERESYCGGRVECNFIGRVKAKTIYKLDINSQYPYVMRNNYVPTNLILHKTDFTCRDLRDALQNYCAIARVRVNIDKPILPYRETGKTCFPIGEFTVTVCSEALERLLQSDAIKKIYEIAIYDCDIIFANYVDFFGKEKEHFTLTKDKLSREFAKKFMNALYGKWGQKKERLIDSCNAPMDLIESRVVIDGETGARGRIVTYGGVTRLYEDRGENAYNSFVAISSHITEYARFLLWDYIELAGVKNVYYCDTDSLFVNERGYKRLYDKLHPATLGMLKLESKTNKVIIRGCKDYTFGRQVVMKGIRKDAVPAGVRTYRQYQFPSLKTYLKTSPESGYIIKSIIKQLTGVYDKGTVLKNGKVVPLCLG